VSGAAERVRAILAEAQAMITDSHVVYTSGRHGTAYVNKDAVYPNTARVAELCRHLADAAAPYRPEAVCGPAMGGIILAQWTAHHLGVPAVYAEKADGGMALRRGYDKLVAGRRVLVVEDVLNTGGSVRDAVAAVVSPRPTWASVRSWRCSTSRSRRGRRPRARSAAGAFP
jgi:orotate phosphoribosyltransferase